MAWTHDLDLAGGVKLRLRGLTSTVLSGADGNDDRHRDLCVGPWQTAIEPSPDVIDLVMCHHPFDWLDDGEAIEDILRGRAPLQVFSHRHRSRVDRDVRFIRFHAGAVNPDRGEGGWRPCYNLFDVDVSGAGDVLVAIRRCTNCSSSDWRPRASRSSYTSAEISLQWRLGYGSLVIYRSARA